MISCSRARTCARTCARTRALGGLSLLIALANAPALHAAGNPSIELSGPGEWGTAAAGASLSGGTAFGASISGPASFGMSASGGVDAAAEDAASGTTGRAARSSAASAAGPLPSGDGVSEGHRPQEPEVIFITGSTDGLGREVARRMAATGAHVIVHGRDRERGSALLSEIEAEGVGSARFYQADLASFDRVRELAAAILRDYDRLDVLVNNAGIWLESSDGRRVSEDGHELHFQVNYLSGFLLTRMLLPLIVESAPSRIVNVSSAAQRPIDFDDVMLERDYSDSRAYAQSKLAQILFTMDLAEELEGTGVSVNALHPATMMDTNMVLARGASPRADVAEGTEAVIHLITAPDLGTGLYFNGMNPARANAQAHDPEARARLRLLSEKLTGAK